MKRVLMFQSDVCGEDSAKQGLSSLGYEVDIMSGTVKDYERDSRIQNAFLEYFRQCVSCGVMCDFVFSIDYFPVVSRVCNTMEIPYVSWIVDCPMNTLFSKTVLNKCNRIFLFDYMQYEELKKLGVERCFHMPLATDIDQWDSCEINESRDGEYVSDVSFLGNLYNDELRNGYLQLKNLNPYLEGYLDAIKKVQFEIYGESIVDELLNESILELCRAQIKIDLGPDYFDMYKRIIADMIYKEISHIERIEVLSMLGKTFNTKLYTSSDLSELEGVPLELGGYVEYLTVMPKVFRLSKVNINITSKSIRTGIPLRVLDVLGCGGFLITNYQPEIAEYFVDGKELVMYESLEDLKEKVHYYLEHEAERKKIAAAGYKKVKEEFSYEVKLREILEKVYEEPLH